MKTLGISSSEGLDAAVARVVQLKTQHTATLAAMEVQKQSVEERFAEQISGLIEAIEECEAGIHDYCTAHRVELFTDKKSRDTLSAVIGFELTPWRVETSSRKMKWRDVVKRLARLKWGKAYVRHPEPQPDKESLLKDREKLTATQKLAAGITFAQDEQFFIRPKNDVAENSVKEASMSRAGLLPTKRVRVERPRRAAKGKKLCGKENARMNRDEKTEFPSLKFPKDRQVLYAFEVAVRLSCDVRHVYDLVDEGKLRAINIAGGNNLTNRKFVRIPVEAWEKYLKENTV